MRGARLAVVVTLAASSCAKPQPGDAAAPPDGSVELFGPRVALLAADAGSVDAGSADRAADRVAKARELLPKGRWTRLYPRADAPPDPVWVGLPDGRVLTLGGVYFSHVGSVAHHRLSFDVVELSSAVAEAARHRPIPPGFVPNKAIALRDGRVLVHGDQRDPATTEVSGFDAPYQPVHFVFDPRTDTWTLVPTPAPQSWPTSTLLADGRVLVSGGSGVDGFVVRTSQIFDPARDRFEPALRMLEGRTHHVGVLLADGRVLATGGTTRETPLATAELFDPTTRAWSPAARMSATREYHTAVRLADGTVLEVQQRNTLERFDVARYDPTTNRWTQIEVPDGLPVTSPWFEDVLALGDGRVLLLGPRGRALAAVIYDPRTDAWSPLGELPFKLEYVGSKPPGGARLTPSDGSAPWFYVPD
jgi:hypothetical protein